MVHWRRNLLVAWIGCFFTGASFSLVMPFLPVYIESLGTPKGQVEFLAGIAIAVTPFASALFAPIWGSLADRKGRKVMMVRAALGMTFTMGGLAFVPNVYWLILLRTMTGVLSGYVPNSTALIARQTPRERSGWALGTLSTGVMAGTLIAPSIGGIMAQAFGMRQVFIITGIILFITTLLTIFFVQEEPITVEKSAMLSTKEIFGKIKQKEIVFGLFVSTLILNLGINSITPILTLYVRSLAPHLTNILFISGLIVSSVGISALISSPLLGKLGDKIGSHRVLLLGLLYCGMIYLPMAFVSSPLQLGILRFLLGFGTGALTPSINAILSQVIPNEGISRIFSFNQMSANVGQVLGPLIGSSVAGIMGYSSVFLVTVTFVAVNFAWSLFNFRKFLHVRQIG
jgi:MFS family permease